MNKLDKNDVKKRITDGKSLQSIATYYGCSKTTVFNFCKKHGIPTAEVGRQKNQRTVKKPFIDLLRKEFNLK